MLQSIALHQLSSPVDFRLSSSPKLNYSPLIFCVLCVFVVIFAFPQRFSSDDSHLAAMLPPFIIALSNRIDKLVKTRLARGGSDLTKDVPDETVTAL